MPRYTYTGTFTPAEVTFDITVTQWWALMQQSLLTWLWVIGGLLSLHCNSQSGVKLPFLSEDAKCDFIFSILPTSGSEQFRDRILSSPSVLPVTNKTRLTNYYKKCSDFFNKLTKNVLKLKNQVKSMRSSIRPKALQAFCFAFHPSVFRAAQIMQESNCLSADL